VLIVSTGVFWVTIEIPSIVIAADEGTTGFVINIDDASLF